MKFTTEGGTIRNPTLKLLPHCDWAKMLKQNRPIPMHYCVEGDYVRRPGVPVLHATLMVDATDEAGNLLALGIERVKPDGEVDAHVVREDGYPKPAFLDSEYVPTVDAAFQQAFGAAIPGSLVPLQLATDKDLKLLGTVVVTPQKVPDDKRGVRGVPNADAGKPVYDGRGLQCVWVSPEGFEPVSRLRLRAAGPILRLVPLAAIGEGTSRQGC